jgi:hypothetical protein
MTQRAGGILLEESGAAVVVLDARDLVVAASHRDRQREAEADRGSWARSV